MHIGQQLNIIFAKKTLLIKVHKKIFIVAF